MCVNLSCFNVELLHIGYLVNNQEGFVIKISSLRKVAFIVLNSFIRYLVNSCIKALCNTMEDFTYRIFINIDQVLAKYCYINTPENPLIFENRK